MREEEFPIATAHGQQIALVVVNEVSRVRIGGSAVTPEDGPDVESINLTRRQGRAGQASHGRQHIDGHQRRVVGTPPRNMPRPAHHTRHPDTAFETGPLAFSERPGTTAVFAIAQPGAVVGGEDHQRVLLQTALLQGLEHLAHRPVDFFDNIPIEPLPGTSGKTRSGKDRNVRHGMGQIEEEGRSGIALDERDRPLRVAAGQLRLIRSLLDHPIPIDQR